MIPIPIRSILSELLHYFLKTICMTPSIPYYWKSQVVEPETLELKSPVKFEVST